MIPLVQNGHDPASVNANLLPSGISHVKMLARRIAPATIVAWKSEVRRAKVCSGNGYRCTFYAPSSIRFIVTHDPVALPTWSSIVEQCGAQCCCAYSIPSWIQVAIPAGSPYSQMQMIFTYICSISYCSLKIKFKLKHNGYKQTLGIWKEKFTYPLSLRHRCLRRMWHELGSSLKAKKLWYWHLNSRVESRLQM